MSAIRLLVPLFLSLVAATHAAALDILLTNDDGYAHPWINLAREALVADGHRVTLVGPAVNQSGQSAALTLDALRGGRDAIGNPAPGIYTVEGTPATAVILGVREVMPQRPDLVVSGINDGANIGVLAAFSGTVGATVAALNMLGEPIPAIAISSNRLDQKVAPDAEPNLGHARDIAAFVAKVVAALDRSRGAEGPLLPRGIALNINYPAVPKDAVKGIGIYRHGPVDWSLYGAARNADAPAGEQEWDTTALGQGHITVVPINGDYTAPDWNRVLPLERLGTN